MSRSQTGKQVKSGLHPRNKHRFGYDFDALQKVLPELAGFVTDIRGRQSVDFSDPQAVRCLNQALLKFHYGIAFWELPEGYLCPPVPGRVDYVHHLADLLAETAGVQQPPKGRTLRGLDIGAGANGIYPLLASREYGWKMLGSDIDPLSVQAASLVAQSNPAVKTLIEYRLQPRAESIFNGLVAPGEQFDFTMCNPPFHGSAEEAQAGSRRKVTNLSRSKSSVTGKGSADAAAVPLNFGGQHNELWCKGGEAEFIGRMIRESRDIAGQCLWFTSLVSKQDTLRRLKQSLKKAGAAQVRVVEMAQGQKISRFIAWTFMTPDQQSAWTASWR
ncbi:23S rRNA (adenine(1618)-N(6))-methyltransferase RlmF [Aliamphritea hakodatensis]|uniref:23S rRNA (adenine(1618)-N(6))-methyltransferase RlmF n=1 Tax=Aliamphritea hakodatensis TaxID=2895352 RepID=UPI0022FD52E1|nr:23S rRNA (adenine(1618)-N(6))-methyltransferase RlmF [Aliamphritea hakodatensis]